MTTFSELVRACFGSCDEDVVSRHSGLGGVGRGERESVSSEWRGEGRGAPG